MFKPKRLSVCLVLLTTIFLTACQAASPPFECTDSIGCVTIGPDEPIKIGVLQAFSGELAPLGQEQIQSIEIAITDLGGEILDHPLELVSEDSLCSEEGGTTAALKITADRQIIAIIGTMCSGSAVTAAKVISEAGLTMVSGSNTAPSLTAVGGQPGPDWQPGYFRTAHNDAAQGRAAATFAFQELSITKAAVIDDGDAYTQGLANVFSQVFSELGGGIVLETVIDKGDTDMKPVLQAVVASGAELVFYPIFQPEGDFITLQAKEVEGFENITLMAAEGILVGPFVESVGESGIGMYFVGPATPSGSAYDTFVANYQSKYGETPNTPFPGHNYDATVLVLTTIEAVAVQEEDGTLHVGRQALREALYSTSEYQGLTGSLTCDEFGDCGASKFKVVRLDDPAAGIEGLADNVVYTYTPGE